MMILYGLFIIVLFIAVGLFLSALFEHFIVKPQECIIEFQKITSSRTANEEYMRVKREMLDRAYKGYDNVKLEVPNDLQYEIQYMLIDEGYAVEKQGNYLEISWRD